MGKTVKIWGKEIERCMLCTHYSGYEGICNITGENTDPISEDNINKNCPYLQPITKEVIERHGFEIIEAASNDHEWQYELKGKRIYWLRFDKTLGNRAHIHLYTGLEWIMVFRGTINNPMELEFILKSIMLF